jgi:hypothetical protein
MFRRSIYAVLAAALVTIVAAVPPLASARAVDSPSIEPGRELYLVCGWGYESAARQRPVSLRGNALEVRKVGRTATGQRVVFSHHVEIYDESHHRFRLILNRGRNSVEYSDDCRGKPAFR